MKTIIVTGSEGYLGKIVADHFNERSDVRLIPVDIQLGHDLSDETLVKDFFQTNKADYLVNLFAMNDHVEEDSKQVQSLFDVSLVSLQKYYSVNVSSLFSVCREFARHNKGGIVNFTSIYGMVSPRNDMYGDSEKHIGYSITKGAVIQMSRHLAVHLAPHVRVNCIGPGGVEKGQSNEFKELYAKNCPFGRMMKPEEVIGLVEFLCSDSSAYMTGAVIPIDGGWTAW